MLSTLQNRKLEEIKWKMIGVSGKLLVDLLFSTIGVESVGFEGVKDIIASRKIIAAFWHSRILLISYLYKGWSAAILVSRSQDGEFIARVLERQGHEPVRGSTTRGGLRAVARLIKSLNENIRPAVIIPDGPQGPRFKVQPGVIMLAKKTGYPIVPITYSAKKAKIFSSWDRFVLPYPFTRCQVVYGRPVYVPTEADREAESKCRQQLEEELCRITMAADQHFGHTIS
jgi:lysophospholipid acyltransferase (LPLAT)-like uncharacterized protein